MTTIAVQRIAPNQILLCADKRTTPSETLRLDGVSKIFQAATGEYIAVAGMLAAAQAFELFLSENDLDFSSKLSTYRSILSFRQDLSVNQMCLTDKHTDAGDFAVLPLQMLIVNKDGAIYSVMNYGEVIQHDKFFAQGSGTAYALGALSIGGSIYQAMQAASTFDPATSPEYDTYEISIEENGGESNYQFEIETGFDDEGDEGDAATEE